jgi:integrase
MSSSKLIIRNYDSTASKDSHCLVFLQYCHFRKTVLLSTGERIPIEYWDKKRQEVKKTYRGFTSLNAVLHGEKEKLDNIVRGAKFRNCEPTVTYVKGKYKASANQTEKMEFLQYFKLYLEESEATKRVSSIKSNVTTFNHLVAFEKHRKSQLSFESFDMSFYHSFRKYLSTKIGKSAFGTHIKTIKTVLNSAYERKLHDNREYRMKGFKVVSDEADTIYLNDAELQSLYNLDLTNYPGVERVRDLFYVGCYTGFRFGDLQALKPSDVKDDGFIHIVAQKTGQKIIVPVFPNVLSIFQKYDFKLPTISNQKMNEHLKELGKLAGIDEIVTKRVNKGMTL